MIKIKIYITTPDPEGFHMGSHQLLYNKRGNITEMNYTDISIYKSMRGNIHRKEFIQTSQYIK